MQDVIEATAQVADDRGIEEEHAQLASVAKRLASAMSDWTILALRPTATQGPLVVLIAFATNDSTHAAAVLADIAEVISKGYPQRIFEHLGAQISITSQKLEGHRGLVTYGVNTPAWVSKKSKRGMLTRRLLGSAPAFAWDIQDGISLAAFGEAPEREIVRLKEMSKETVPALMITHPTARHVLRMQANRSFFAYGIISALIALLTHGAPDAKSTLLPSVGRFAMTNEIHEEGWHTTIRIDRNQIRTLMMLWSLRESR